MARTGAPLEALGCAAAGAGDYKLTTRIVRTGRIESGSLAAGEEIRHHAGGQDRQDQVGGKVAGSIDRRAPERGPIGRHHASTELFIERGDVIAHVGSAPRDTVEFARDFLAA